MTENYVEKYKEEGSESPVSSDDDNAAVSKPKEPEKSEEHGLKQSKRADSNKFSHYTFDPKDVLKDYQGTLTDKNPLKSKYSFNTPGGVGYGAKGTDYNNFTSYMGKPKDPFSQPSDLAYMSVVGEDVNSYRKTEDYKTYAKNFDQKYSNENKEMNQVSKDLLSRTSKIDGFIQELMGAKLDTLLYRNRLVRELEDVKNDLKEAYNNISVLMKDRTSMKDQFCVYKVQLKKLKGCIGTFYEDCQA